MKVIKILIMVLILSISGAQAQDLSTLQPDLYVNSGVEEIMESSVVKVVPQLETSIEKDMKADFLLMLLIFISSGVTAFVLCWLFPKSFQRASAILAEKNKFRVLFEGIKVILAFITIALFCYAIKVGIFLAILATLLVISLYVLGLPVFSIGVLNWFFDKKGVKFEKLTKRNKLVSLISMNLILMMIVLPFALLIPEVDFNAYNFAYEPGIISNLVMFLKFTFVLLISYPAIFIIFFMLLFGMGMLTIRLTEVIKHNKKKL
jgi:hypothetical protein